MAAAKNIIRRRTGQFSGIQIMFAAILCIGLFLAIDFSTRISASQPIHAAYDRVRAEIELLRREQGRLIAERDYVRSDAYVADWARTEGKLVLPGDVLVIPVPAGVPAETTDAVAVPSSVPLAEAQTTLPQPDTWTLWWNLFFDGPPPQL